MATDSRLLAELIALREAAARDLASFSPPPSAGGRVGAGQPAASWAARGLDVVDSRPYQRGDDLRSIDWKVTARQGRPHTKVFAAERERPLWLVVDAGASMRFGSRRQLKVTLAARAAAWLAWTGRAGGHAVGGVCCPAGGVRLVLPRRGDRGVLALLAALCASETGASVVPDDDGLAAGLAALRRMLRFGDRVVVLSDFYALDDEALARRLAERLAAVAERAELLLVRPIDPLEQRPPPAGRYPVERGNKTVWLDTADPAVADAWPLAERRRAAAWRQLADRLRASTLVLSTADDPLPVLAAFGARAGKP